MCGCGKNANIDNADMEGVNRDIVPVADGQEITANSGNDQLSKGTVRTIDNSRAVDDIKENTLMIYVIGSDLESKAGAASDDFEEMKKSGIDTDKTNVVIFTGGCKKWFVDISNQTNTVVKLESDGLYAYAETDENMNMADPETLLTFIDYAYEEFPAENYSLIFWDHGGGPVLGYGVDELNGRDSLTLDELDAALKFSHFKEKKLEWVGFDACLMSSIEVADVLDDYADYLIASQETEPGAGWNYLFLSEFNRTSEPERIADRILGEYSKYYDENAKMKMDLTLACMNLSKTKETVEAVDSLFSKMQDDLDRGEYYDISVARDQMKCFGVMNGKGNAYDLVDLKDCAAKLSGFYRAEADELSRQIDDFVVNNNANVSNACGVSIYFPFDNIKLYDHYEPLISQNGLSDADAYNKFVPEFVRTRSEIDTVSRGYTPDAETTEEEILIQLTEEEQKNMLGAYYTVLYEADNAEFDEGYAYRPVVVNVRVEPDENGVLHIPANPKVYGIEDGINKKVMGMVQTTSDSDRSTYRTLLANIHESGLAMPLLGDNARFIMSIIEQNDTCEIQNAELQMFYEEDNSVVIPVGKNTIDLDEWESIDDSFGFYMNTFDEEGKLLPFTEWKNNGWYGSSTAFIDSNITVFSITTSELQGDFFCQLVIEDKNGSKHATNLYKLISEVGCSQENVKTAKGNMEFLISEGEAALVRYRGEDKEVVIPSKVAGVPVTKISGSPFVEFINYTQDTIEKLVVPDSVVSLENYAFCGLRNLKEIRLSPNITVIPDGCFQNMGNVKDLSIPKGVTSIGRGAFCYSKISELTIPENVESIGYGAFSSCGNLTDLKVDENNKSYYVKDNILYTADGKTLVAAPGGVAKINKIIIPEGVERIERYAFRGRDYLSGDYLDANDRLLNIVFPSSLKRIERFALCGLVHLDSIELPESLEYIGSCNFYDGYTAFKKKVTIHIGKNLRFIGHNCFDGYIVTEYTVDKDNEVYTSKDGNVMNASGDVVEFEKSDEESLYDLFK